MTSDATIVSGRRVADRYRLLGPRDDDAWDAIDERLRRDVVVHLLAADADAEAKTHFAAEARTLARVNHRNVVATYDTGADGDGTSYRVDELAGGDRLDLSRVADAQRLPLAVQLARALVHAHDLGLVHGHLTSANVLVHEDGRLQVLGLRLPRGDDDIDDAKRVDVTAVTNLVVALASPAASPLRDLAVAWTRVAPPSVVAMQAALEAIPDPGTAEIPVLPDHSLTTGVPTRHRGRQVLILGAASVAVAVVLAAVAWPDRLTDQARGPAEPLRLSATSFDPEASPPTENESTARLALDGNAATSWATERYRGPNFGNLKTGVGLVLRTDGRPAEFSELALTSPTHGWRVEIFVADQAAPALSGWGRRVASAVVQGAATVGLSNARGAALLIWISDPGDNRQVRISEVKVQGRA